MISDRDILYGILLDTYAGRREHDDARMLGILGLKSRSGVSELVQEGALKAPGPRGRVGSNPTAATRHESAGLSVRVSSPARPRLCDNQRVAYAIDASMTAERGGVTTMADDAAARLYQAFVSQDPSSAIAVIEKVRAGGVSQDELFDSLFAPAMSLLGGAWASGAIDEYTFTQASVVAEQITSFVTPAASGHDTGITVIIGSMHRDYHAIAKNTIGAALKEDGYRIVDLGVDVRPAEFLERIEETGARIIIVCAEMAATAAMSLAFARCLLPKVRTRLSCLSPAGRSPPTRILPAQSEPTASSGARRAR